MVVLRSLTGKNIKLYAVRSQPTGACGKQVSFPHELPNFVVLKAFDSLQQPVMKLYLLQKKELVTKLCHIIKSLLRRQQM